MFNVQYSTSTRIPFGADCLNRLSKTRAFQRLRQAGSALFMFFLVKGLLWLSLPAWLWLMAR